MRSFQCGIFIGLSFFYAVLFISFIYFSFVVSLGCMTFIPPAAKITEGGILKLRHSVREQRSHRWKKVTKADMGRRDVMRKVMSLAQNFFLVSDGVLMVSQQAKWKWMKIMKIRLRGLYKWSHQYRKDHCFETLD